MLRCDLNVSNGSFFSRSYREINCVSLIVNNEEKVKMRGISLTSFLERKEVREISLIHAFLFSTSTYAAVKWFVQLIIHSCIHQPLLSLSHCCYKQENCFPHLLPLKEGGEGNLPHLCLLRWQLYQNKCEMIQSSHELISIHWSKFHASRMHC